MGCYDSVVVKCPRCGNTLEYQSKADMCLMRELTVDCVPAAIAADLDGEIHDCKCGSRIMLRCPPDILCGVAMRVVVEDLVVNNFEEADRLNDRELAQVLASLRYAQKMCDTDGWAKTAFETMPQFEGLTPLTVEEIDALCEKLNVGAGHEST